MQCPGAPARYLVRVDVQLILVARAESLYLQRPSVRSYGPIRRHSYRAGGGRSGLPGDGGVASADRREPHTEVAEPRTLEDLPGLSKSCCCGGDAPRPRPSLRERELGHAP